MYICSHDTFLGLKIDKNGYCGNDGFIFTWDLGVIFLGMLNFKSLRFQKNFFKNLGLKGVIEKCVGVSFYTYFRDFFSIKNCKKMCLRGGVKNCTVTCEKCIY